MCPCGQPVEVLGGGVAQAPHAPGEAPRDGEARGGPYRSASAVNQAAPGAACPFCGNECPPMVRICPHCDVRLEDVRCQRCFSLQPPGTFACTRCRHALELEPMLDATDAPCPRCRHPLEAASGELGRAHECPRCGGIFVPRHALAEILCAAEVGGALRELPPPPPVVGRRGVLALAAPTSGDGAVHYVSCPQCHDAMNRVNFGKVSAVIVDVCKLHGTWFDPGELTRVVAFAGAGGMERSRAREKRERGDAHPAKSPRRTVDEGSVQEDAHELGSRARLEQWRQFLTELFTW